MIKTCPACNAEVDASAVYCPQCNQRLDGRAGSPEMDAERAKLRQTYGRVAIVVGIGFVLLFVTCIGLLLPSVTTPKHVGWRSSSKNNLKQIGLGLHNYHEVYESLPAGGVYHGDVGYHSWMTQLLPHVDQGPLYNQINFSVPFDHPRNAPLFTTPVREFINPAFQRTPPPNWFGLADYSANVKVMGKQPPMRFKDISDGLSSTVLAGEIRNNFPPWGSPANSRDLLLGINRVPQGFGSPHRSPGAHLLMGDGSVRFLSDSTSIEILSKLAHPTDGLEVGDY